jgi:hypothetical protein
MVIETNEYTKEKQVIVLRSYSGLTRTGLMFLSERRNLYENDK